MSMSSTVYFSLPIKFGCNSIDDFEDSQVKN